MSPPKTENGLELRKIETSFGEHRLPSNVSFGQRLSGKCESDANTVTNVKANNANWNNVVYGEERLATGEKTTASIGSTPNVFEEWRAKSFNAISSASSTALKSQRFQTSVGAENNGSGSSSKKMQKFPPMSPEVPQVKLPSEETVEVDNVTPKLNLKNSVSFKPLDLQQEKEIKEEENSDSSNSKGEKSLFSIPPGLLDNNHIPDSVLPSEFAPSKCPSNSHSPQSLYISHYAKKKSNIAMVEEDRKKKRESIFDPKNHTTFYPGLTNTLSQNDENILSKSIIFPKHAMRKIADQDIDLNTTIHQICENYEETARTLDKKMVDDFMNDDSTILPNDQSVHIGTIKPSIEPQKRANFVEKKVPGAIPKNMRLFENFIVIGADLRELECEIDGNEKLIPEILYEFNKNSSGIAIEKMNEIDQINEYFLLFIKKF